MINFIRDYYNNCDEEERLASKRGSVEFLTTMRYIQKYLKKGMRVLEIGAGTGRYSRALAADGYTVDAVELVEHNIEIFKSKITADEKIMIRQGDAVDLSFAKDGSYDIVLLLGPMYHLFRQEDKLKALSEAVRVAKKGGIIFAAYCISDASVIGYGFVRGNIFELIGQGLLETEKFKTFSRPQEVFELHRKEDVDELMHDLPVKRLHYVATDLFTRYIPEAIDSMDDKTFEMYLRYHYSVCERADMVGVTNHSLDIFTKI